jgi:hypothetical protein
MLPEPYSNISKNLPCRSNDRRSGDGFFTDLITDFTLQLLTTRSANKHSYNTENTGLDHKTTDALHCFDRFSI